MSLPDIDFDSIRLHRGDQANAFEELCCQLAEDEPLHDVVRFDRKGRGGDAGVECFATHVDSTETGWQVKYYSDIDSMLAALEKSLATALAKHPKMRRFVACFPFDLSDARREKTTTALTKWNTWRTGSIAKAEAAGRRIEIDRWDEHALKARLTADPKAAGRIAFWFDQQLFAPDWIRRSLERTLDSLGNRYSPESHIDLPIRKTILAALRDPSILVPLAGIADDLHRALGRCPSAGDAGARTAVLDAADALRLAVADRPTPFPTSALREAIDRARKLASQWHSKLQGAWTDPKPSSDMTAVSELTTALLRGERELRSEHWARLDARVLLVVGAAGQGKSHLLADACSHQLDRGCPAIMILGGKLPDAEPWGEILRDLDMPRHLQVRQLLGALNAAAQASGVRALIAIDALNEKNGQRIWPERLPGLLRDAAEFPWITVVLSCRDTYEHAVIPPSLDAARLPRIIHAGFTDEEASLYLRKRGVGVPETPNQAYELRSPLFARIACDALLREGETQIPDTIGGISDAFALFASSVVRRVEATLGASAHRKLASKAIDALVDEMAAINRAEIGFDRADGIVRAIYDGDALTEDLLFQLESEGLLAVEFDDVSRLGSSRIVRFTFERMGDHAIANRLLDRSKGDGEVAGLCAAGSALHGALTAKGSRIAYGLVEALAILLPERFATELPDLNGVPSRLFVDEAFRKSLLSRRATSFTPRTLELVEASGAEELVLETLVALSTEPAHAFNARWLDAELRASAMPARDASWTIHLADSDAASHLIDWAWNADQSRVSEPRAELAASQLAWFFTASNRPIRDRATKALVAVLADRPRLASSLWADFKDLDYGYVVERVAAALYGAAMQGRWPVADLSEVAKALYRDLFADRAPPPNVLLRDHALGLIDYVRREGALDSSVDQADLEGPFVSEWPIDYVSDETIEGYTRSYDGGYISTDEIVSSCRDGDFARYVLDGVVSGWSPAPIGTTPLPTHEDLHDAWHADFMASASPEMVAAHQRLLAALVEIGEKFHYHEANVQSAKEKAAFKAAVGSAVFEEWRARAEDWRPGGMYPIASRANPAGFNLAWARRWVIKRAHDLGWSEALHGDFDRFLRGGSRHEHQLERIGKKYQWLALYELVARMSDNLAPLPRGVDDTRLRNLDPSLLVATTSDDGWRRFEHAAYWLGVEPELSPVSPSEAVDWVPRADDVLDGIETVAVASPDARQWLVLAGFESWSKGVGTVRCEAWRRVKCFVVRREERDAALGMLAEVFMTGNDDVPFAEGSDFRVHLGEFPWRSTRTDHDDWIDGWRTPGAFERISIRPTTASYSAEASGYDGSLESDVNLLLPARWLMDALGLTLSDGRSIRYRAADGTVLFEDPSVASLGRSAALVDRPAFLALLEKEGLTAVWTVAGEKGVYWQDTRPGWGGRLTFTRLFFSEGTEIRALARHENYERPTAKHRAAFLGKTSPTPTRRPR